MKVVTFLHNIQSINQFVLKPTDSCLSDISLTKKLSVFSTAFLYNIVMGGFLGITILYLIDRFLFRIENNMEASAANLFAIVLLAPLMEEIIFRLPLRYRDNYLIAPIEAIFNINLHLYWRRYLHFIVYFFVCLFAVLHVVNYQNTGIPFYLMAVFITLPQLIGGLTLSFTRLRLGFWWAVAQHALYNLIFMLLAIWFN